jgi:hypothetical protein
MWAMMPDLIVAIVIFSFFLLLAVAAPIWGVDSRDGIESSEYARRAPWLYDRRNGRTGASPIESLTGGIGRKAGASVHVGRPALTVSTVMTCAPGPEAAY